MGGRLKCMISDWSCELWLFHLSSFCYLFQWKNVGSDFFCRDIILLKDFVLSSLAFLQKKTMKKKNNNTCAGRTFCLFLLPVMSQHNFHWSKRNFVSTSFSFSDKKRDVWHVIVFYMLCLFVYFFCAVYYYVVIFRPFSKSLYSHFLFVLCFWVFFFNFYCIWRFSRHNCFTSQRCFPIIFGMVLVPAELGKSALLLVKLGISVLYLIQ